VSDDVRLYIYFVLIKLLGYLLVCFLLARYYKKSNATGALAGIVRTLIGMGVGSLFFYGPGFLRGLGGPMLYALLVPVRVVEWGVIFWLFYGRPFTRPVAPAMFAAIAASFVLDLIGALLLAGMFRGIIC
jgi:hypothetical protein